MKRTHLFMLLFLSSAVRASQITNPAATVTTGLTQNVSFSNAGSYGIVGTTTTDNAPIGNVGESTRAVVTANIPVNSTGTNQWFDLTSVTLSSGDWDVSGQIAVFLNAAGVVTQVLGGISSTAGNSSTGLVDGDNEINGAPPTAAYDTEVTIANWRVSISSKTTYYLKCLVTFTSGTPQAYGRLSARRMR